MNLNITIFGQTITFVLFVLFCMKYIWPPLITVIEKRQKDISDNFSSIERLKKMVDISKIEAANHLKDAKISAQLIIENANQYKIQIIEQAKDEAKNKRNKILSQAQLEISCELNRVREDLRRKVSKLIVIGVEKIIHRTINESVNLDIVNSIINKI